MADQVLTNSDLAELLALAAEQAKQPLQKALRRASRRAFMWPEEASQLLQADRSLQELSAVGPTLERIIRRCMEDPPAVPKRPEIRQNFLTVPESRAILEKAPSWVSGIKGDLQMHSDWSDGEGTLQQMADAAVERGYEYVAITDHAKGLKIAGGINEDQLDEQAAEIEKTNQQLKRKGHNFRLLRSIELNLDVHGNGDMDEAALAKLDLVLGCFHSALRRREDQTERYIAALRNPAIQILGHPRGRIYNFRMGLSADWERVFGVAAELEKAVEIDGYPDRQDLSQDLLRLAKRAGCRISLGTDSHGPSQLRFIDYSLAAAVSAGIKQDRILNFMARAELLAWVDRVRGASKPARRAKKVVDSKRSS